MIGATRCSRLVAPTCETTDQRGVARPQDGNGDGLARCDIGAFERRAATTDSTSVMDLPVAFQVVNSNTSGFSCPSDFKQYTVRGHLVGPATALASSSPSVTFYLYGFEGGEFHWRMTEAAAGVRGYHWPLETAKLA